MKVLSDRLTGTPSTKPLLIVGFALLDLAVVSAIRSPARGYELSIYRSTPAAFWLGVVACFVIAVHVSYSSDSPWMTGTGVFLAGAAMVSVYALPLFRGYYFYGLADSFSHYGIVLDLAANQTSALELIYPFLHVSSLLLHRSLGLGIARTMEVTMVAFPVIYISSVWLLFSTFTRDHRLRVIGAFSAVCLLPLNAVGMFPWPFPSTLAVFYAPFVIYLLLRWLRDSSLELAVAGLVSYFVLIILHPQQALSVGVFIAGVFALVFVTYRYTNEEFPVSPLAVVGMVGAIGTMFVVWVATKDDFVYAGRSLIANLVSPAAGSYVAGKTTAVSSVGTNVVVFALKLFGVDFLYALLTGTFLLVVLFRPRLFFGDRHDGSPHHLDDRGAIGEWIFGEEHDGSSHRLDGGGAIGEWMFGKEQSDTSQAVLSRLHVYFVVGVVPLVMLVGIYVLSGERTNQAFRYVGFVSFVLTITGAIAIRNLTDGELTRLRVPDLAVKVVLVVCLVASVLTIHPAPYVLNGTNDAPESQLAGVDLAFEYMMPGSRLLGTYISAARYVDYTYGRVGNERKRSALLGENTTVGYHYYNRSLPKRAPNTYVSLTCHAREVHTTIFDGQRFSAGDFAYLARQPSIDKPVSTGCFDLFYVH